MTPRWLRLAAYLLLVAMGAAGFWRVETIQRDQCEAFDQFARNLGRELEATEADIDRFITQLHDDLDAC